MSIKNTNPANLAKTVKKLDLEVLRAKVCKKWERAKVCKKWERAKVCKKWETCKPISEINIEITWQMVMKMD
jgi:hypothetical protein